MNDDQKVLMWRGLLDADQNARYWRAMTLRYVRRERLAKIFLAILSSATVAGWSFWRDISLMWQSLSVVSAVVSVALPIFDVPKHVEAMGELHEKWHQLLNEYETLWSVRATMSNSEVQKRLAKLKQAEVEAAKKAVKLPNDDERLGAKTYNEVLRERHLPTPTPGAHA